MSALSFSWKAFATIAVCSIALAAAGRFSAQLAFPMAGENPGAVVPPQPTYQSAEGGGLIITKNTPNNTDGTRFIYTISPLSLEMPDITVVVVKASGQDTASMMIDVPVDPKGYTITESTPLEWPPPAKISCVLQDGTSTGNPVRGSSITDVEIIEDQTTTCVFESVKSPKSVKGPEKTEDLACLDGSVPEEEYTVADPDEIPESMRCRENQPCAMLTVLRHYCNCSNGKRYKLSFNYTPVHYEKDPCIEKEVFAAEAFAISTDGETVAFLETVVQQWSRIPPRLFFAHWKTGDAWEGDASADALVKIWQDGILTTVTQRVNPNGMLGITPDMRFVAFVGPLSIFHEEYAESFVVVDLQTGERDVISMDPLRDDPALALEISLSRATAHKYSPDISTDGRYLYAPYWQIHKSTPVVYDRQERKFSVVGWSNIRNNEEPIERIMLQNRQPLYRYADGAFGTEGYGVMISPDGKTRVVEDYTTGSIEMSRLENNRSKVEIRRVTSNGSFVTMSDDGFSVAYATGVGSSAVYDWNTEKTTAISIGIPHISGNGRFIAGTTTAALVPEDTDGYSDVYVYDRDNYTYTLVKRNEEHTEEIGAVMTEAPQHMSQDADILPEDTQVPQDDIVPREPEFAPLPPTPEEYSLPSTPVDSMDSPSDTPPPVFSGMQPTWYEDTIAPPTYTTPEQLFGDGEVPYPAAPQAWPGDSLLYEQPAPEEYGLPSTPVDSMDSPSDTPPPVFRGMPLPTEIMPPSWASDPVGSADISQAPPAGDATEWGYDTAVPLQPTPEEYGLPSTPVDSMDSPSDAQYPVFRGMPLPTEIMPPSWAEVHPAYSPESYTPAQPGDDGAEYPSAPQAWPGDSTGRQNAIGCGWTAGVCGGGCPSRSQTCQTTRLWYLLWTTRSCTCHDTPSA